MGLIVFSFVDVDRIELRIRRVEALGILWNDKLHQRQQRAKNV